MQPLFREGEIIFVNPDLSGEPGDYVVVGSEAGGPEEIFVQAAQENSSSAQPAV
ncbi:MAG TPA: hypothetical protein VK901_16625 [Nitrospiraceae bacterium]|nr:hypothetical protein [Nitrospiraceae bacterium]